MGKIYKNPNVQNNYLIVFNRWEKLNSTYIQLLTFSFFVTFILSGCYQFADNYFSNQIRNKPNIIFILADDLGYGDLGSYGQTKIQTPHLDQMASEGMRFTQHYSGSTVCAPSRSVLITGLHTGHTHIRGNREHKPIGQTPLPYAVPTVTEILKEAGYTTGAFGKWGLGYPGSEGSPSLQGFDVFFGYNGQRRAHFYYPEFLFREVPGQPVERVSLEGNAVENTSAPDFPHPGSGPPTSAETYAPEIIHEQALSFIEKNSEQPFFLYYPSQIPHASLEVPEENMELYLDENGKSIFEEKPTPQNHYVYTDKPMATYAAMISSLDQYVGQILDKVRSEGISENTLVIFTSDNGSHDAGGYHYSMLDSNAPLRGGKRDLYEGGIRVPMIAWWPGVVKAGSTNDHISAFWDILPTFTGLAGTQAPPVIDGLSMVPTLLGEADQQQHNYLYWEFHRTRRKTSGP